MEIKEAIGIFYTMKSVYRDTETLDALNMAISALEKQDGKKPFYNGANYECPYCNATIINGIKPWHCDICGQRIDWSE